MFAKSATSRGLRSQDDEPQLPDKLIPLCLLNLNDELRSEVKETLMGFREAGIQLKFISGDNPETVSSLVRRAGFVEPKETLLSVSGLDLSEMDDAQFYSTAEKATIFGRVRPRQKEKLINAYGQIKIVKL